MSFHCKTCEEIAKLMLHALHEDPNYKTGLAHSQCREVRSVMKFADRKVLLHAKTCKKVKK